MVEYQNFGKFGRNLGPVDWRRHQICLFDLVVQRGRLEETEAAAVFRQVVLATAACLQRGVLHRDIKAGHISTHQVSSLKIIYFYDNLNKFKNSIGQ